VEKNAQGGETRNRAAQAAADTTLELQVASWRTDAPVGPGGAQPGRRSTLSGDIRHHPVFGSQFVRARDVWVYLPPGYAADSARRYPVVYLHDGNNVFNEATSFLGVEWGVDEVAEQGIRAGRLPDFIAVAVANTPDRTREYTWTPDPKHGGGTATDYARFLIEELKPFIDRTYRTDPRPEATAVVGSSLGGIVSLWLGLEHPEVFRRIGCVSPAAGWADRDLERLVRAGRGTGLRIWLDIGTAEATPRNGEPDWWLQDARSLRDALVLRGYVEGRDLHYEEVQGAKHNEVAWAARIGRILAYLLQDLPSPPESRP
jgi:predicted alpha/beta superfamily hydrolase